MLKVLLASASAVVAGTVILALRELDDIIIESEN